VSRPLSEPEGTRRGQGHRVWSARPRAVLTVALALCVLLAVAAGAWAASPAATPQGATSTPAGSGSFTPAPQPLPTASSTYAPGTGGRLYAENCSGCHGANGEGYVGPPLAPAGFASLVSGMVEQGGVKMPPFGAQLSPKEIDAIAQFVSQEIADPASHSAEAPAGGELFRLYCSGCHSSTGSGGAMPVGRNAPNIRKFPAAEALAAMIIGPGNMPALAGNAFDVRQQTSVALYVQVLAPDPPSPGGAGIGFLGPVPEGAVGGVALLLLILVAVWLAWRSRKAVPREP
jgi:ubiquinol-cytochrome c reductase cytochrome c subunit